MDREYIRGDTMQYLPHELKNEYDFLTRNNPDILGLKHPMINLSDCFRAYFILIHYFTDTSTDEERESMLPGIRSMHLLASALSRQNVTFGGKSKYTDPIDICATLFFGMVKNHSFNDGNKRTALLVLLYQLQLYGYLPKASKIQFEKLVLHVADSSLEEHYGDIYKLYKDSDDPIINTIAHKLRRMTAKKDNTYHINPTMKEFCSVLESRGVICRVENGKVKLSYQHPGEWRVVPAELKSYTIPFHGWTRTVGSKTARDALRGLGLYDQFPTYQTIFDIASESLYTLIDDFKEPLRRLKDE